MYSEIKITRGGDFGNMHLKLPKRSVLNSVNVIECLDNIVAFYVYFAFKNWQNVLKMKINISFIYSRMVSLKIEKQINK